MKIDSDVAQQFLDELLPVFESLEAQTNAILRLVKDSGMATDQDLAPYLQQAGDAAGVKWRAARLRFSRLLSLMERSEDQAADTRKQSKEAEAEQTQAKTLERGRQGDSEAGRQPKLANGKAANAAEPQVEGAASQRQVGAPQRKERGEGANLDQAQSASRGDANEIPSQKEFEATSEMREHPDACKNAQASLEEAERQGAKHKAKTRSDAAQSRQAPASVESDETRGSREQPAQDNHQNTIVRRQTKTIDVEKKNAA